MTIETIIKKSVKTRFSAPILTELDDIAVLVMTSGSTGRPKPIIKTNRNLLSTIATLSHHELHPMSSDDVVMSTVFHHLIGQLLLYLSINSGAKFAINRFNSSDEQFFEFIHTYNITHSFVITTQLNYLVKNYNKFDKNYLKSLRDVYTGGAPLSPNTHKQILELYGFDSFRNG